MTHAMLAFEFSGGWKDMQGSVAVTVLQFLLGGGGSFSAGGPGTDALSQHTYNKELYQIGSSWLLCADGRLWHEHLFRCPF